MAKREPNETLPFRGSENMSRIARALLAAIVMSLPVVANAAESKPIPQDPERQEQWFDEMLAWNRRTLGGAYEKVGKKDPRWDKDAREALDTTARFFSHDPDTRVNLIMIHNAAKRAVDTGCDDPLVLYLYARSSEGPYDPGIKELDRRNIAAAKALEHSAYPPFRRSSALARAALAKSSRDDASAEDRKEAEQLITAALRLLPMSAEEDERTPHLLNLWYVQAFEAIEVHRKLTGDYKKAYDRVDAELIKTPAAKGARLLVRGRFYQRWAWEARGRGLAKTVTEEGWKKFAERLTVARKSLEEAWSIQSGDPTIATQMMWVVLGLQLGRNEMEKWFERAMSANGASRDACAVKLEWLSPRWHGTREELVAFGRACRDTKNWRSGIPLLVADAHLDIRDQLPSEDARNQYMRSDDVWFDIATAYTEHLKHFYTDYSARSRYAVLSYWCGRYQESHRQFLLIGNNLRWDWSGLNEKFVKDVRDFVAKYMKDTPVPEPKEKVPSGAQPAALTPKRFSAPANGLTRTFVDKNCSYTLPGEDWFWLDSKTPNALCAATDSKGHIVTVTFVQGAQTTPFSAEEYEKGLYSGAPGQLKKRGGHVTTLHGRQCYQAESVFADGRTMARRALLVNGSCYSVGVIGGKQPVEQDPDFEMIMNGFAFTEPPDAPAAANPTEDSPAGPPKNISEHMGEIAGGALFVAVIIGLMRWSRQKKDQPAAKRVEPQRMYSETVRETAQRPESIPWALAADSPRVDVMAPYRKGMKDLGRGLIALALFQIVIGGLILAALGEVLGLVIVGGLGLWHFALGIIAIKQHAWVNYVIAAWGVVILGLNMVALTVPASTPGSGTPGIYIGFLVAVSLLYHSIKNINALSKARLARFDY
jgi:hypothetical protein